MDLAPRDRIPKPPKTGYMTEPAMVDLYRMSLQELGQVENFKISNEFGSVQFLDKVDLTDVDLADVVTIVLRSAEVYDDTRHA